MQRGAAQRCESFDNRVPVCHGWMILHKAGEAEDKERVEENVSGVWERLDADRECGFQTRHSLLLHLYNTES